MRARNRVLTEDERADVHRYRQLVSGNSGPGYKGIHWPVDDLPDEAVFGLTVFAMWRLGEQIRAVGRALSEVLPERFKR